jgi:hypothetical protein
MRSCSKAAAKTIRPGGRAVPTEPLEVATTAKVLAAPVQDDPGPNATPLEPEDGAFSLWLNRSLRQAYDAVVAEPIPDTLLRLIEESRGE